MEAWDNLSFLRCDKILIGVLAVYLWPHFVVFHFFHPLAVERLQKKNEIMLDLVLDQRRGFRFGFGGCSFASVRQHSFSCRKKLRILLLRLLLELLLVFWCVLESMCGRRFVIGQVEGRRRAFLFFLVAIELLYGRHYSCTLLIGRRMEVFPATILLALHLNIILRWNIFDWDTAAQRDHLILPWAQSRTGDLIYLGVSRRLRCF